jgi:hypothetical protein
MRRYASQARTNVLRSTSISPLIIQKQRQTSFTNSKNLVHRSSLQSPGNSPNIRSSQIIEKKNFDRQNQQPQSTSRQTNNKSQMITYAAIIPSPQKPLNSTTPSTARSVSFSFPKV